MAWSKAAPTEKAVAFGPNNAKRGRTATTCSLVFSLTATQVPPPPPAGSVPPPKMLAPPPQLLPEYQYYRILDVRPDATTAEVRKAYRKLALRYHPDKQSDSDTAATDEAAARFREASHAHALLTNDTARATYDEMCAACWKVAKMQV